MKTSYMFCLLFLTIIIYLSVSIMGCQTEDDSNEVEINIYRITNYAGSSNHPSLTWTGTEYGIVWEDNRDGNNNIYFTHVDYYGNKKGNDIQLTNTISDSEDVNIIWNGGVYAISWRDEYIYFNQMDVNGNKLGSDKQISISTTNEEKPCLVWDGIYYGITFADPPDYIAFAQIDTSGNIVNNNIHLLRYQTDNSWTTGPYLVWNGIEYGLTWTENQSNGSLENLYFANINSDVSEINMYPVYIGLPDCGGWPVMAWSGNCYGIFWDAGSILMLNIIDRNGNKITDDLNLNSFHAFGLSTVWSGSEYIITGYGDFGITYSRIDSNGNILENDTNLTNDDIYTAVYPDIVWNGNQYAMAFADNRSGNYEIYLAIIEYN